MFKKAIPLASPLKMSVYGPHGSGKTLTSLLFAEGLGKHRSKRVAVIDTEYSTKTYRRAVPERRVHPEAFDFDVLDTRSLAESIDAARSLDPTTHGVLILDSISRLWDAAKEAYVQRNPGEKDIPLRAWSSIKRPYKELMQLMMQSPLDLIITGRQKSIFEEEDGKLSNVGVAMRAEGETQYEPDICLRFELLGRRGEEEGTVAMFAEKDRYGILSGRTFPNPRFSTIEPLVPYLGTEAPKSQTDEEAAELDGDLITAAEDKSKAKAEKSAGILADMNAKVLAASKLEDLGVIAAEIKKIKRHMVEEHLEALRVSFSTRSNRIQSQTAGAI